MRLLLGRLSVVLLAVLAFTGCSTFEKDWRLATLQPPAKPGTIVGPWKGDWLSQHNGHHGELRCLVTETHQNEYEFRFKATYLKVLRSTYTVVMPTERTTNGYTFQGQEDLGYLVGGVYTYDGKVSGTNFNSTYRCKYDFGTFQMTRP